MFDADMRAAGRWGLAAGAVLVGEHLACWPAQGRLDRPLTYTLGVATLLGAYWGWGWERGQLRPVAAVTLITALGGAATWGVYRLHAALVAGAIADTDLIPKGARRGTRNPYHRLGRATR